MTIDNERELRDAYERISQMDKLCERIAQDTTGYAETREAEIDGVNAMIRKIERQIAAYYASRPETAEALQKVA